LAANEALLTSNVMGNNRLRIKNNLFIANSLKLCRKPQMAKRGSNALFASELSRAGHAI